MHRVHVYNRGMNTDKGHDMGDNTRKYTPFEIQSEVQAVMVWATAAACKRIDLAHAHGAPVQADMSDGLWQSYCDEFDAKKQIAMGVRDLATMVLEQTLRWTIQVMDVKARQVLTCGGALDGDGNVKVNPFENTMTIKRVPV